MLKNKIINGLFLLGCIMILPMLCKAEGGRACCNAVDTVVRNREVTVIVKDERGVMPGASVSVKNTTRGSVTDIRGEAVLKNLRRGEVIVISFIGYITQEINYNGENSLHVVLQPEVQELEETVITGYGGVQKARTKTASAVNVPLNEIKGLPLLSVSEGLGGRVIGVTSQQSSGAPGETSRIWIRGGSNILYVIDDIVMETAQGEVFFNRLRPEDIASMTILKDASATAIYGPRANDGVVVVATKRGGNQKMSVTFHQKITIQTPSYRPRGMNSYEFAETRNALALASYEEKPPFDESTLSKLYMGYLNQHGKGREEILQLVNEKYELGYTLADVNNLFDPNATQGGDIENYYQSYDPWEFFDHVQPMSQSDLNVQGGSERLHYYSGISYISQQGISSTYNYNQANLVLNTDVFLLADKSLKLTMSLNGSTSYKKSPARGEKVFTDAMYGQLMPTSPARWSTGKARKGSVESLLHTGFNNTRDYRIQAHGALKWSLPFVEGLTAGASVSYNHSYSMNKQFNHDEENVYDNPVAATFSTYNPENTTVYQRWDNYTLLTGLYQLDYNRSFGKHNLSAMLNYQSQTRETNFTSAMAQGYPTTLTPQIDKGAITVANNGNETKWGSASYIGRVIYDYDGKYLFQYNATYSGSLSYSPDKRWGLFHALSVGWVVSEEKFFKRLVPENYVNMLKIRGGFGLVGNEIGSPFSYLNQYSQSPDRVLFGTDLTANVTWYESWVANDLTWSKSRQWSGGIDFSAFNHRLEGTVEAFLYLNHGDAMNMNPEEIRTDILGLPNIPQINAPFETNRKGGYEISLSWKDRVGKVGYRLEMNYSHWDQRSTRASYQDDWNYYKNLTEVGHRNMQPVYWAGFHSLGLFSSWEQMYNSLIIRSTNRRPGTFHVEDLNHDGQLSDADWSWIDQPGTVPLTQYGFSAGIDYHGFSLDVFFQGATDVTGTMPSPLRSQQDYMWNYGQYVFKNAYMPWKNNTDAGIPLPVPAMSSWGSQYVDGWIYDASYLKLKSISLTYDVKNAVLKQLKFIEGLDVSFVVLNAFTWTKKDYPLKNLQDPEFITTGADIWKENGTLGSYPTQRSFTLGLTITL